MRETACTRDSVLFGTITLAFALLLCGVATQAGADTIYLKNGRVIHSSTVRIEGDQVEFLQYGGWVTVPRSIIDRIEDNERGGPEASPTARPATAAEGAAGGDEGQAAEGQEGAAEGQEGAAEGQEEAAGQEGQESDEPPPEETRAYWRARLQPLFNQMDRIEADLDRYRPLAATSAGAAARVDQLEEDLAEVERRVEAIQQEARRLGVPPGWVRR